MWRPCIGNWNEGILEISVTFVWMNVGILLVTHPGIGLALKAVAASVLGQLPLKTEVFEVPMEGDPDLLLPEASAALRRVDDGAGVLLLSDVHGATPGNLGARLAHLGTRVRQISGANLPMLLRIMNYPELPLDELCLVAVAGARNGVIHDYA